MFQSLFSILVAGSFCWFSASSLWLFPHSISYFNEAVGGPLNGPEHLLGSNVDWGQDLRYALPSVLVLPVTTQWQMAIHGLYDPTSVGFPESDPAVDCEGFKLLANCGVEQRGDLLIEPSADAHLVSMNFVYGMRSIVRPKFATRKSDDHPATIGKLISSVPHRVGYSMLLVELKRR
jgi:hypothetical protein